MWGQKHIKVSQFWQIRIPFQSVFSMYLKIGFKYEYLDYIENNIFPFPISNHDAIRHIKNISKEII